MTGPANGQPQPLRPLRIAGEFIVRRASVEDATALAALTVDSGLGESGAPFALDAADAGWIARGLQTGQAMLVVERHGAVVAMARHGEDEGVAWFDLLASRRPGAGWTLVRTIEMAAQDGGLRLVRCRIPDAPDLEDYFGWLGYLPVARERTADDVALLVLERRLPLLTVREQRREDATTIAELTGRDPYPFELGHRPGWFIVADGDRVAGVAWVSDAGGGLGRAEPPVLLDRYRGRRLEPWIFERLAYHGAHAGFHTLVAARDEWLDAAARELEERGWHRLGDEYVRRLAPPPAAEEP